MSENVDKIGFTGSTNVGRFMYKYAAESNLKHVSAELGGKSPQIILDNIGSISKVAASVIDGVMGNQGEVCSAGTRILVARTIHEEFSDAMVSYARGKYVPGDPLDPKTTMGPLVNKTHQKKNLGYINATAAAGLPPLRLATGLPKGQPSAR